MPILQVGSFWGLVEVLCLLFTQASCFSAQSALQLIWCSHKMPHWRAYSNTANLMQILSTSSTTAESFSCRGYSAASNSSRSHANAGKLVQWSFSLCFFSGWTWSFIPITFSCIRWKLKEKRELLYYSQKVISDDTVLPCTSWFYIWWTETKTMGDFEAITKILNCRSQHSENLFIIYSCTGEREAAINVAEGKKQSQILASEARKMEQINLATGKQCCYRLIFVRKL